MNKRQKKITIDKDGYIIYGNRRYTKETYEKYIKEISQYATDKYRRFTIYIPYREQDTIDFLESKESVNEYVKNLIKEDIERKGKNA